MAWDDKLLPEQRTAASYDDRHARLLAGPGTGKTLTLTRRICYLVEEEDVDPREILALTFTRAAAHELRQRVVDELGEERLPRVTTLHSFALREILRNSKIVAALPQPIRIADDWEERYIILEDLKRMLQLKKIGDVRDLFNRLSAGWQTLTADEEDWDESFPSPRFLGAWREHRARYGYSLRSELVYQLKGAMEQHEDFDIEGDPSYLLVDEYQDLNRCDLRVVRLVSERGAQVYAAGDDDQSIYGFRYAHPVGIRLFPTEYGAKRLELSICKRCDPDILDLGLFVARLDHEREEKSIHAEEGRDQGTVALLRFRNQTTEAKAVAMLCRYLCEVRELPLQEMLILLRSDHNAAFSSLLREQLAELDIDVSERTADIFDTNEGRIVLALLRLCCHREDSLSWRTVVELRANSLGRAAVQALYGLAGQSGTTFGRALARVAGDPSLVPRHGGRLRSEFREITSLIDDLCEMLPAEEECDGDDILELFRELVAGVVDDPDISEAVMERVESVLAESEVASLKGLLTALSASDESIEQEIEQDKVNILTMHKAKGLTAEATIIVAAEEEYIPGRATGDAVGDERRLLYVSLTRAKHYLFITYCNRRTGQQQHTGNSGGKPPRHLTQFLRDAPIIPVAGVQYIEELLGQEE